MGMELGKEESGIIIVEVGWGLSLQMAEIHQIVNLYS